MKKKLTKLVILIFFLAFFAYTLASTQTVVEVHSNTMNKDVPVSIILPDTYRTNNSSFPVLFLLHGAGDNHLKWIQETDVEELADTYNMIVVCPDAGGTSWYFDSPIDPNYQYETFTSKELVNYIDKNYRTLAAREFRAISGNSMGGHGALFLAICHQDIFGIAGSQSGGVDIRPFSKNWGIRTRLGDFSENKERWEAMTVINLVKTLKNNSLQISIDCGVSDFFIDVNRALHQQLLQDNIDHVYTERPGNHGWTYWKNSIKYQMLFFSECFKKNAHNAPSLDKANP